MKSCPFGVPTVTINKSPEQLFSTVLLKELDFAHLACDKPNTVYELLYPKKIWAGEQVCKATKAFMDEGKTYYEVRQDIKYYIEEPLRTDEEVSLYSSYDQNHNSVCLAIHEKFANGNQCALYYKDGPLRHLLNDGDTWQSESLVFEDEKWVLDISCQNTVSSNWIVRINGKEIPCIEQSVLAIPYRGDPPKAEAPEFVNKYYFNEDGLCVLQRRYMGAVWAKWKSEFWEKLKGNPLVTENKERFYLYCDYIPENVLA